MGIQILMHLGTGRNTFQNEPIYLRNLKVNAFLSLMRDQEKTGRSSDQLLINSTDPGYQRYTDNEIIHRTLSEINEGNASNSQLIYFL